MAAVAAAVPRVAEADWLPAPSAGRGERSWRWAAASGAGARPGRPRFPKKPGFEPDTPDAEVERRKIQRPLWLTHNGNDK